MNTSEELFDTYLNIYGGKKFKNEDQFFKIYEHINEQYPL